ncbi:MAG: class I SAM-dependent methyltransferase, partial [bacterium]
NTSLAKTRLLYPILDKSELWYKFRKEDIQLMPEWNHNTHYHKLMLKHLPEKHVSALDIGSGFGLFSFRLSSTFKDVVSLEPDQKSINYSKLKYKCQDNITFIGNSFLENNFEDRKFDFISAIASIHHMDFEAALEKMKKLLKPGGKMAILGLYKESSVLDYFFSLTAVLPNYIMNSLSTKKKESAYEMITTLPKITIKEIKQASDSILKKYHFKRLLFWRYLLVYENKCSKIKRL